jgi:hypothetical protein
MVITKQEIALFIIAGAFIAFLLFGSNWIG